MSSIFTLNKSIHDIGELNQGITKMVYDQVAPTRDITGANFSNGQISFKFEVSGSKWWVPNRSYLRTRFTLSKVGGAALVVADGVAPNMSLCANLFQSAEFRVADKTISRVADFLPQIDALNTRLEKSKAWIDTIGNSTNWWETKQAVRQQQVSADGTLVEGAQSPGAIVTAQAALGAPNTTTVAYDSTTGTITFSGAGAINAALMFQVGDSIILTGGAVGDGALNVKSEVLTLPGGLVMTVRANIYSDITAAVIPFSRSRPAVNAASRQLKTFELTWQPPLSIFGVEHAMPCGRYELVLNPQTATEFKKKAIESVFGVASKVPDADFAFSIDNMYLYVSTMEGPRVDDLEYLISLQQTRCQADGVSVGFTQKQYDVSPSTTALTIAYQDVRAGNNTSISSSKFKSYDVAVQNAQELKLTRFFVNYAGLNKPSPDASPAFGVNTDLTTELYLNSQLNSGGYFENGGCEKLEEYHDRGAYYYISWPREGTDRSTRVTVNHEFGGFAADVVNMRCLLFDHSKAVARVRISQGRIIQVDLEDQ